jgi:hypothetical protein
LWNQNPCGSGSATDSDSGSGSATDSDKIFEVNTGGGYKQNIQNSCLKITKLLNLFLFLFLAIKLRQPITHKRGPCPSSKCIANINKANFFKDIKFVFFALVPLAQFDSYSCI